MGDRRIYWLDAVRVTACLLVLLRHSLCECFVGMKTTVWVGTYYLTMCCVPLFFMISGALIMPTTMSTSQFLRRRVGRVLWPLLFWSVIYIFLFRESGEDILGTLVRIVTIPISLQGAGDLWFIYALVAFYLIVPVISPWLRRAGKNELTFYLLLIVVAYSMSYLSRYLPLQCASDTNVVYYFAPSAAYMFVGWYMVKYSQRWRTILIFYAVSVATLVLARLVEGRLTFIDIFDLMGYSTLGCLGLTALVFKAFESAGPWLQAMEARGKRVLVKLSNLTFGVYLCHRLVLYIFCRYSMVGEISDLHLRLTVIFTVTIAIAFVAAYLMSWLPYSRYIVGYHHQRRGHSAD